MSSPAAFTNEVKAVILQRSGFRCDRCGLGAADNGHFHHRTPRRAGGSSREDLGLPSNGVLLHPRCHDTIESKRKIAAQLGFLVGYGTLPSQAPIMLWNGWHLLNDDGTATRLRFPPSVTNGVGEAPTGPEPDPDPDAPADGESEGHPSAPDAGPPSSAVATG